MCIRDSYSIVTTEANQMMKYIHNRKEAHDDQRMPIVIKNKDEKAWLDSKNQPLDFAFPNYQPNIIGFQKV